MRTLRLSDELLDGLVLPFGGSDVLEFGAQRLDAMLVALGLQALLAQLAEQLEVVGADLAVRLIDGVLCECRVQIL